jgi:hypothetical protein
MNSSHLAVLLALLVTTSAATHAGTEGPRCMDAVHLARAEADASAQARVAEYLEFHALATMAPGRALPSSSEVPPLHAGEKPAYCRLPTMRPSAP